MLAVVRPGVVNLFVGMHGEKDPAERCIFGVEIVRCTPTDKAVDQIQCNVVFRFVEDRWHDDGVGIVSGRKGNFLYRVRFHPASPVVFSVGKKGLDVIFRDANQACLR